METLFTHALGLSAPWSVISVDFRQPEGAIHFAVECQARQLPCPACGAADQPIHDRIERRWQHLHFFQCKAFIHARLPRVACSACGKTGQVQPAWARPGSGFSLVMGAFVIALCKAMPVAHVARLVGVSDDRIWRVPGCPFIYASHSGQRGLLRDRAGSTAWPGTEALSCR